MPHGIKPDDEHLWPVARVTILDNCICVRERRRLGEKMRRASDRIQAW